MAHYVTDTHSLLWYLSGSERLGATTRVVLDGAANGENEVLVPAIVIAEFIRISEKYGGKIDVAQIISNLQEKPGFRFTHLTPEIVLGIRPLTTLPDLHDRLIVAEAIAQNATLITRDKAITSSGLIQVVW
jgi:PIN domain nuclease of toxin-antitoxin system